MVNSPLENSTRSVLQEQIDPALMDAVARVPLTPSQLDVLLIAKLSEEANCAFNESLSLNLEGALDVVALDFAWQSLLERHEVLLMSLSPSGDRMRVDRQRKLPIVPIDASSQANKEQTELLKTLITAEGTRPFDLLRGPLLRATLVTLAPKEHVLLLTVHRLICDKSSLNRMINELGQIYSAELRHASPELSPVLFPPQHAMDVQDSAWRERQNRDLAYWDKQLTPRPELLTLPTDRSRPAIRSFAGATFVTELSGELVTALRQTSANSTLFMTLLAGWQILLWRLSENNDPVTMISAAEHSRAEDQSLVGCGAHPLPIRAVLDPAMTAEGYIRALENVTSDAYKHQAATYASVVRGLSLLPEPGRLPMSEIGFNVEGARERAAFDGLDVGAHTNGKQAVYFDLFLNIVDTGDGLELECDYNAGLYDEPTIAGWLTCYRTLLFGMTNDLSQSVAKLPLLEAELREYLLEECNATATGPLAAQNIPAMIAAAFAAMPSHAAADFYGLELTRTELAEKSDRLAAWLIRHGAGQGSLVGIYMDRSLEMLVAVLGVMKAGAAYVPLDPMFPRTRIEQIVRETKAPVLLTLTRHLEDLPKSDAQVLCLDIVDLFAEEPLQQMPEILSNARAYVIFTSGSTGRPKGVEVTHGSVVNLLTDVARRLDIGSKDRLLAITTLSFDISVLEMLLPLVAGGTVVIASRDDAADGVRLMDLVGSTQATVLQATPVTWRMLLEFGFQPRLGFKMLCGGESWTPAIADKLLATGGRLWNMYGPTETTVWSSITEVKRGATRMTIGPPIANTRFYVLDARLQLVPPGIPGELAIAGAGVARGYFENETLTAEKFLIDPFVPAQRMYRTGDEVRQLPDGRIEFLGRLDQQVKLRGFRIELGEVETAICALPDVRDAVVVLRRDKDGEAFLVGYYTGGDGHTVAAFRQELQRRLPIYMIPKVLKQLSSLPLTPNGKVDRRALPDPEPPPAVKAPEQVPAEILSTSGGAIDARSARSDIEQVMLRIWRKIFETEDLDVESNFFDLGGDSLLLVKLQSAVAREFGVRLTTADIFRQPTIAAFASWLKKPQSDSAQALDAHAANPRVIPIKVTDNGRPIFVISQSMIFRTLAEELGPDQTVYALQMLDEDVTAAMESASFEQIAAFYCGLIREVQPTGPYRVAGWCVSGWLAYEVARQLEQQGAEIELLMIMDAWAPGYWTRHSTMRRRLMITAYLGQRLRWSLRQFKRAGRTQRSAYVVQSLRGLTAAAIQRLPIWLRRRFPAAVEAPPREDLRRSEQLAYIASRTYQPGPLQGKVLVFNSEEQRTGLFLAADMGWAHVVGRPVQAYSVFGDHQAMFYRAGAHIMATRARETLGLAPSSMLISDGPNDRGRR